MTFYYNISAVVFSNLIETELQRDSTSKAPIIFKLFQTIKNLKDSESTCGVPGYHSIKDIG